MEVQAEEGAREANPNHSQFEVRSAVASGQEAALREPETDSPHRIALLYDSYEQYVTFSEHFSADFLIDYFNSVDNLLEALLAEYPIDAVVASTDNGGWVILETVQSGKIRVPVILLTKQLTPTVVQRAKARQADDIFEESFREGDFVQRLHFLFKKKQYAASQAAQKVRHLRIATPLWKRGIDVALVGSALLVLSPLFLLVALLIRLDSRGPVFYTSKRVGSGFRIFDLYKFRTMRTNADQMIKEMASLNIYDRATPPEQAATAALCTLCREKTLTECERPLFWDGQEICEKRYLAEKEKKAAFMKFQNDPRITKVGQFLRNTSLDELPQLVNILKGDLSLVGNRPLPIYEAERLTTDDKIMRFAGPAGLTGYWQVTKRSKRSSEISEAERIEMDIYYVRNFSFWLDLKIILKTFPALLQSENV